MSLRQHVRGFLKFCCLLLLALAITPLSPKSVSAQETGYNFVNASTITGPRGTYTLNSAGDPPGYYLSPDTCPDIIPVIPAAPADATTIVVPVNAYEPSRTGQCGRFTTGDYEIVVGNLENRDIEAPPPDGTESTAPSCEGQGGSTGWFACPIIQGMLGALQGMTVLMGNLLEIRPLEASSADPIYVVWRNVRNIALGGLVIAMLYMIFVQAIRPDTDAYFIKRIIPRIGFAGIGIMLSFVVCAFFIDLFNVLGIGMQSFMLNAVEGLDISAGVGSDAVAGILAAIGVGGVVAVALNPALLWTIGLFLLPVVLAFVTAVAVIVLRQIVIIALIIFAPIAFVAWILPNLENYFKKWLNTFTNMLMMFPLIMVLLGAGSIYAVVITNGGGLNTSAGINQNNFVNYLLALLGLGVVMAAIPFTIRAASGVLKQVAGAINNPNRGPIDRLRKGMEARRDYNREALRNERRGERASQPDMKKFRRGVSRFLTGDYGYGSPWKTNPLTGEKTARGQFGDLQETEAKRGALTADQKINLLEKEARDKQKGISKQRHSDVVAGISNEAANEYLLDQHANGATVADRNSALEMLIDKGEEKHVDRAIRAAVATNDRDTISELSRTIQDNFPKVDLLTPQHSRGDIFSNLEGRGPYQPNMEAVAGFKGERISQVKANSLIGHVDKRTGRVMEGAIPVLERDGNIPALNQLISNYADTIPEKRDQPVVDRILTLINTHGSVLDPTIVAKARAAFGGPTGGGGGSTGGGGGSTGGGGGSTGGGGGSTGGGGGSTGGGGGSTGGGGGSTGGGRSGSSSSTTVVSSAQPTVSNAPTGELERIVYDRVPDDPQARQVFAAEQFNQTAVEPQRMPLIKAYLSKEIRDTTETLPQDVALPNTVEQVVKPGPAKEYLKQVVAQSRGQTGLSDAEFNQTPIDEVARIVDLNVREQVPDFDQRFYSASGAQPPTTGTQRANQNLRNRVQTILQAQQQAESQIRSGSATTEQPARQSRRQRRQAERQAQRESVNERTRNLPGVSGDQSPGDTFNPEQPTTSEGDEQNS